MSFKPVFENGLILKKHMLEALRDYPIDYVNTIFSGMGDGVVSGLKVMITEDDGFYVNEGIVKIKEKIYLIKCSEVIKFHPQKNYVYLDITTEEGVDGTEYCPRIIQKGQEDESMFELFRYVKNARMKHYASVEELFGDVTNRIDQRKMRKSIQGGYTLCEDYYRLFAKCILASSNARMKDIAFAYQCLNSITNVEIIKEYFYTDDTSNETILLLMKRLVENRQRIDERVEPEQEPAAVNKICVC